jgi:hypothetical protein
MGRCQPASMNAVSSYPDRIKLAIARAAGTNNLTRQEFHQRCVALVSHTDDQRADYLLAASDISGVSVGVLLNERPLADEVREIARRVNVLSREHGAS